MSKIIKIDTSDNKKISVEIDLEGKKDIIFSKSTNLKSEAALPLIDTLLKKHNLNISEMDEIKVNLGPGSYTGLRVGAAIANTLGYLLKIPINGRKIGELTEPVYNK